MLNRTLLVAAFLASAASPAQLSAQKEVPASLSAFKPHEVVEAVIGEIEIPAVYHRSGGAAQFDPRCRAR